MQNQQLYNERFKDAPWYQQCTKEFILFVGMGGIGSNSMYNLSKTIPANYYIMDMDSVEDINIGCQFFSKDQIGRKKVAAVQVSVEGFSIAKIHPIDGAYDNQYLPITITGLDNMNTRKQVFEEWKKHDDRELFVDGRLRANLYEVYVVTKGKEEEYEATLFGDEEVDDGPCTFKQTAYFGMLIGARITHVLVNYLTNKYSEEGDVAMLPFKIQEFGEPFYIDVQ